MHLFSWKLCMQQSWNSKLPQETVLVFHKHASSSWIFSDWFCHLIMSHVEEKKWNLCQIYGNVAGLDPALPLFMSGDTDTHLSAGDAKFVGTEIFIMRNIVEFLFFFTRFISISDVIHTDGGFFGIPWVSLEHKCRVLIKFCFWKICSDVRRWVTWTFTRTAVLLCNQDVCKKSYQKIIFWESSVSSRVRNEN